MSKIMREKSAGTMDPAKPPGRPDLPARGVSDLVEGRPAPAFSLPTASGPPITLADFKGRQLAIFFFPRANTPGCTQEASDFEKLVPDFQDARTAVVGISADPIAKLEKFKTKYLLSFPLASDEELKVLPRYGAWGEKSMYGKAFLGVLRSSLLIDARGCVVRVWRNVKVKGHADSVLAAARQAAKNIQFAEN